MRDLFPGYYQPSEENFNALWRDAVFIPDTNVLLRFYRYSEITKLELFSALEHLTKLDRLWTPYQVALEYQRRRLDVIEEQHNAYRDILTLYDQIKQQLQKALAKFDQRHPMIDVASIIRRFDSIITELSNELKQQKKAHPNWFTQDEIRDRLDTLLAGKIGESYPSDRLENIYQKGSNRYIQHIPPGFEDMDKLGDRRYGDLVIWFQIIDYAKTTGKSIIFITDDSKPDWWQSAKSTIPNRLLIQEIYTEANVSFYIYKIGDFLKEAKQRLQIGTENLDEAIAEIYQVQQDADNRIETPIGREIDESNAPHSAIGASLFVNPVDMRKLLSTPNYFELAGTNIDFAANLRNAIGTTNYLESITQMIGATAGTNIDFAANLRNAIGTTNYLESITQMIGATAGANIDNFGANLQIAIGTTNYLENITQMIGAIAGANIDNFGANLQIAIGTQNSFATITGINETMRLIMGAIQSPKIDFMSAVLNTKNQVTESDDVSK